MKQSLNNLKKLASSVQYDISKAQLLLTSRFEHGTDQVTEQRVADSQIYLRSAILSLTPLLESMNDLDKQIDETETNLSICTTERDNAYASLNQVNQDISALTNMQTRIQDINDENKLLKLIITGLVSSGLLFYLQHNNFQVTKEVVLIGLPVLTGIVYSVLFNFEKYSRFIITVHFPRFLPLNSGLGFALAFCGVAIVRNAGQNNILQVLGSLLIASAIYILTNIIGSSLERVGNNIYNIARHVSNGLGEGFRRFGFLAGRIDVAPQLQHGIAPGAIAPELQNVIAPNAVAPHLQHGIATGAVAPQLQSGIASGAVAPQLQNGIASDAFAPGLQNVIAPNAVAPQLQSGIATGGVAPQLRNGIATGAIAPLLRYGLAPNSVAPQLQQGVSPGAVETTISLVRTGNRK